MSCFSAKANKRAIFYRLSDPQPDGLGGFAERSERKIYECWCTSEHVKGENWYTIEDHARVSSQRKVGMRYANQIEMRDLVLLNGNKYNILSMRHVACDTKAEGTDYTVLLIERCKDV